MATCKYCGNEISEHSLAKEFCSMQHYWDYEDAKQPIKEEKIMTENVALTTHLNIIKRRIVIHGKFFISNKTLKPYLGLKPFDDFIVKNNLMITNLDKELSVIKKSII